MMKKKNYILLFLQLVSSLGFAQNVSIPDVNFKAALVAHVPVIDTSGDGEIQTIEATAFTGTLNVSSKNIINLTGLEAFTEITKLDVSFNKFTTFSPSANTKITEVFFGDTSFLTSVDLTNNEELTIINGIRSTNLTSINLDFNTKVVIIDLESCNLTSLDVIELTKIENIKCSYNSNLTTITFQSSTNTTLENLQFQNTKVASIDLSKLSILKYITCRNTLLTDLDFSSLTELRQVFAANNSKLVSVDVKNGQNGILTDLELNNSPKLFRICVDNVAAANAKDITEWKKDGTATYIANCNSTWSGTTSTDWATASNWNNGVPTNLMDVIIPEGSSNTPEITGNSIVEIQNLDSKFNAKFIDLINGHLTIKRNYTRSGTGLRLRSNSSLIVKGDVGGGRFSFLKNITTTNWYLISSLSTDEDLSNYLSNNNIASNVAGTKKAVATYNNNTSSWDYVLNGASGIMTSGKGYAIKMTVTNGQNTLTGTMPLSDANIALTEGTSNKFNLIGNPYPSYIPANSNADATKNILTVNSAQLSENTIWFWDQSVGVSGEYITINQASPSRFISPSQGFFVRSKAGGGTFSFTEAMQSHQTTDVFNRTTNNRFEISLAISDATQTKRTAIYYINGTTTAFDNGYDSSIFGGIANDFGIYTQIVNNSQGEKLAIQSLPDNNYENMVVPIGINAKSGAEIVFSADVSNSPAGINIYLEDRANGLFTKINTSLTYRVTIGANNEERFFLHTKSSVLNIKTTILKDVNVYALNSKILQINGLKEGEAAVKLYNVLGEQVMFKRFKTKAIQQVSLPKVATGVYIVNIQTEKGSLNTKIIIQ